MTAAAERAAERCGRRAAGLLEPTDTVLALGGGSALRWALKSAGWPQVVLLAADPLLDPTGAARVLEPDAALAEVTLVLAAGAVRADGAAALEPAAAALLVRAAALGVPRYLLAPDGPVELTEPNVAPTEISAVVTSRGVYRPEMVHRHLTDGDAPLDVIPLT